LIPAWVVVQGEWIELPRWVEAKAMSTGMKTTVFHISFRAVFVFLMAAIRLTLLPMVPGQAAEPVSLHTVFQPLVMHQASPAELKIAQLQYSDRDEYIQIRNRRSMAQDMTGWEIVSVIGPQTYRFAAGDALQGNSSVYVHSGPGSYAEPPVHLQWTTAYIWRNEGDEARLYDAEGNEVDQYSY